MQATAKQPLGRVGRGAGSAYVRWRLCLSYIFILALAFGFGALIYRLWPNALPRTVYTHLEELAQPAKNVKIFDFIASIIYNSVDIFKISAIIIISGFTYITAPLCRLSLTFYGIAVGWSFGCMLTQVCTGVMWPAVAVIAGLLHCALMVASCVRAELAADELSKIGHPRVMLTSRCFWNYILWLFVSFGYTLMITVGYRLCLIFIL